MKELSANKILYLFRHAKAVGSDDDYGDRIKTAEILPEGIPPTERLARFLLSIPDSGNYCSPFIRCRQTAKIISDITGKQFTIDDRIKEYVPADESFANVGKRVVDFLHAIQSTQEKSVIICTHGIVIAAMKHLTTEGQFLQQHELDYPKPGELWIMNGKQKDIKDFN